jgi:hypothetical protein
MVGDDELVNGFAFKVVFEELCCVRINWPDVAQLAFIVLLSTSTFRIRGCQGQEWFTACC